MLGLLAVITCPIVFAALLVQGLGGGRLPVPAVVAALTAGGTITWLAAAAAVARADCASPLVTRVGLAFGAAALAGGWVAARTLPRD